MAKKQTGPENIVKSLKIKAATVGSNLTQICNDAGVPRQTIERWKNVEPKTIRILRKLENAIEKRRAQAA